mgnify:CR=1 FL=1
MVNETSASYDAGMRIVDWNGIDLPEALHELPAGRYVLQPVDALIQLDSDEENALISAKADLDAGNGLSNADVLQKARELLRG